MTTTINASPSNGLVQTADGSGILKVQSNGKTTNALAWVAFSSAGGVITIASNYNVSSITYVGTGNYTVNYSTALTDANYSTLYCAQPSVTNIGNTNFGYTPTTSNVGLYHLENGVAYNSTYNCVAIFGN